MKFYLTGLLLYFAGSLLAQNPNSQKYYRHLRYNHVSPHVEIAGIFEISEMEAKRSSHYVFKYDEKGRLIRLINNHYHFERRHPLTTPGVYETRIEYPRGKEIRVFFDKAGNRTTNDRKVYREEYALDKKGFKTSLKFFDDKGNAMESNWEIASYRWNKYKKLVVEKRYNLAGTAVDISPYFAFGTTGILYGKNGAPLSNYNLDEQLKIKANAAGVASYKDQYDENGNHIVYSYHDENEKLTTNQWGFSIGKKEYDTNGNLLAISNFDTEDQFIRRSKTPSNVVITKAHQASSADSTAIKAKSLGYLIALQELKPALMKKVFHPQLAKRTPRLDRKTQQEIIKETTYEEMIEFARSWNKAGNKFPANPTNEVIILDIYDKIATVKLISDNWVEYLHLIKVNHQWSIINLLWQYQDVARYPKVPIPAPPLPSR